MGPMALIVISLIVLLLFANRLPALMRSLGRGMIEFKKGITRTEGNRDDPPTAGGIYAPIKPQPSGGSASRVPESDKEE